MTLERLRVEHVRCIETADLAFDARRNLFYGANASGKTSLLEAIYFLGRARSFRASKNDTLVHAGASGLTITGNMIRTHRRSVLGLGFGPAGLQARLDGQVVTGIAELATIFPVQAIDPELHQLIEEDRSTAGDFDWGVFHGTIVCRNVPVPTHASAAKRSAAGLVRRRPRVGRRTDRHRRTDRSGPPAISWDTNPQIRSMAERPGHSVELHLSQGWVPRLTGRRSINPGAGQRARLTRRAAPCRPSDPSMGSRPEIRSRGQQKLVAAAMLLGQLRCDSEQGSPTAALLVDDPAAELDSMSLKRLLGEVLELPLQLFITALDPALPAFESLGAVATFHVEHGKLTRLI
jgi:DNA replication and repair protein RecF